MDVTVSSRHVEVSPALRAAAIEKIGRLERYLEDMDTAEVHFSAERRKGGDQEICEVTMFGHGHYVRAKVAAPDPFAAVDSAVAKLEHQLHKLKTRLVAKHHGGAGKARPSRSESTDGQTRPAGAGAAASGRVSGGARRGAGAAGSDQEDEPEPRLVKTKRFAMRPMGVAEAILQMDLLGHEFYMFLNADSGDAAVVYRRADGDIGLIEVER